jgi:hypothetical protein
MLARGRQITRLVVGVGGVANIAGGIAVAVAGAVLGWLALAGAMTPIAEGAPRGRVVRVERAKVALPPRFCELPARGQAMCLGSPREGERVAVLVADRSIVGSFVIEEVREPTELYERGLCSGAGVLAVKGRGMRGTADPYTDLVGLRGATLGARARVLTSWSPPSGRADEIVLVAVDGDGDGDADVAVTRYRCDATGAADPDADFLCYDTFVRERDRLERTSQDILRACS